jgi:GNAT superfamily N-acetyltransferase
MNDIVFRRATADDVPAIIAMLVDDKLGSTRETPDDMAPYLDAFREIDEDPRQHQIVVERDGRLVGTLQLTVIPGLSQQGMTRALVEAVRIDKSERGKGLGTALMHWVIQEARRLGCRQVQLTSNNARPDAHRFYERLGFTPSHVGFKLKLDTLAE